MEKRRVNREEEQEDPLLPVFVCFGLMEATCVIMATAIWMSGWMSTLLAIYIGVQFVTSITVCFFMRYHREKELEDIIDIPHVFHSYIAFRFTIFLWSIWIVFMNKTFSYMTHPIKIIYHVCTWTQAAFWLILGAAVLIAIWDRKRSQKQRV